MQLERELARAARPPRAARDNVMMINRGSGEVGGDQTAGWSTWGEEGGGVGVGGRGDEVR